MKKIRRIHDYQLPISKGQSRTRWNHHEKRSWPGSRPQTPLGSEAVLPALGLIDRRRKKEGMWKEFLPLNALGRGTCPWVGMAAATPGCWKVPVRCLVKTIQPTGESFSSSSVIYLGFKENIRHPLLGLSVLQRLRNVFYKSRVEAEGKIYPSAKGQRKVNAPFTFSK